MSVLGTHLAELIRRHAHELFSRQDAKKLLDRVAVDNSKVVEDLVPKLLPLATVQRVLQNLLRERVSIRDAVSILEALGEAAGEHPQPGAAHRIRAAGDPAHGSQAVSEPRTANCRPGSWTRRSSRPWNRRWSTASSPAISVWRRRPCARSWTGSLPRWAAGRRRRRHHHLRRRASFFQQMVEPVESESVFSVP